MAEHSARALALAGRALDPNAPRGPSLALGQLLLREAFVAAVRAISGDVTLASVEQAADILERRGEPRRTEVVAALGRAELPDTPALLRAEMEVAYLVDEATGQTRLDRATRRACWALGLLVVAVGAALALLALALGKPWEDYAWSTSSAWSGFPQSGTLGQHGAYGLLFHTEEEDNPWVVVDLRKTRTIREVLVRNRADVDSDRGLPLVLELGGQDRQFGAVSTRTAPFDVWDVKFTARPARYVRLRAQGRTILHLREIQIR
jgi:hypothetical protein